MIFLRVILTIVCYVIQEPFCVFSVYFPLHFHSLMCDAWWGQRRLSFQWSALKYRALSIFAITAPSSLQKCSKSTSSLHAFSKTKWNPHFASISFLLQQREHYSKEFILAYANFLRSLRLLTQKRSWLQTSFFRRYYSFSLCWVLRRMLQESLLCSLASFASLFVFSQRLSFESQQQHMLKNLECSMIF